MRRWMALAALLVAAVALILLGVALSRGLVGWLRGASDAGTGEPDPMFEAPAEQVTRPPELSEDGATALPMEDDPSRHWVYSTLTPVDTVTP